MDISNLKNFIQWIHLLWHLRQFLLAHSKQKQKIDGKNELRHSFRSCALTDDENVAIVLKSIEQHWMLHTGWPVTSPEQWKRFLVWCHRSRCQHLWVLPLRHFESFAVRSSQLSKKHCTRPVLAESRTSCCRTRICSQRPCSDQRKKVMSGCDIPGAAQGNSNPSALADLTWRKDAELWIVAVKVYKSKSNCFTFLAKASLDEVCSNAELVFTSVAGVCVCTGRERDVHTVRRQRAALREPEFRRGAREERRALRRVRPRRRLGSGAQYLWRWQETSHFVTCKISQKRRSEVCSPCICLVQLFWRNVFSFRVTLSSHRLSCATHKYTHAQNVNNACVGLSAFNDKQVEHRLYVSPSQLCTWGEVEREQLSHNDSGKTLLQSWFLWASV